MSATGERGGEPRFPARECAQGGRTVSTSKRESEFSGRRGGQEGAVGNEVEK